MKPSAGVADGFKRILAVLSVDAVAERVSILVLVPHVDPCGMRGPSLEESGDVLIVAAFFVTRVPFLFVGFIRLERRARYPLNLPTQP